VGEDRLFVLMTRKNSLGATDGRLGHITSTVKCGFESWDFVTFDSNRPIGAEGISWLHSKIGRLCCSGTVVAIIIYN
jgi:hypothetical protein